MRLARFFHNQVAYHGILVDDQHARPLKTDPLISLETEQRVLKIDRLLAPIVPSDILCIGLNYHEHAKESGGTVPEHPMLFIKSSNTLADPEQAIAMPRRSSDIDYEAELCVVIGRDAKDVSKADALKYVLGYTCANDVSARDWQKDKKLGGGQFARGKSFDHFAPIGPWIVTPDEVENPNALRIRCELNGQVMQDGSTGDMIFDVPTLIESLSSTMTLKAGSVILTGTPSGVGMARTPPVWIKAGDRVSVTIEKIGTLSNAFV